MPSETEIIIAFIFKRSGKTEIEFTEFYLTLSMDLKWFTPKQAKDFINTALKQNLLSKKDEMITANFDINKISVPIGFYPSKKATTVEKKQKKTIVEDDVLTEIIKKIIEKTKISENKIVEMINNIEKEKNITPETAALLVGKEHDVSLEEFYEKTEETVFK